MVASDNEQADRTPTRSPRASTAPPPEVGARVMAESTRRPSIQSKTLLPFSEPEIRQIWSFLDGAIMDVGTRQHLWRSWGLCPRHAWCYAVAELEIRGGRPFSTTILYEELVGRAARLISRTKLLPWALVAAA
jgi:hypothetical protein